VGFIYFMAWIEALMKTSGLFAICDLQRLLEFF